MSESRRQEIRALAQQIFIGMMLDRNVEEISRDVTGHAEDLAHTSLSVATQYFAAEDNWFGVEGNGNG